MRPWVIKIEKAWLRFIQVVSVNSSVQGGIKMNNKEIFLSCQTMCIVVDTN